MPIIILTALGIKHTVVSTRDVVPVLRGYSPFIYQNYMEDEFYLPTDLGLRHPHLHMELDVYIVHTCHFRCHLN